MKQAEKLTSSVVDRNGPKSEPYRLWDTTVPQLFLRVQPSGTKSWNVQWTRASSKAIGKWPGVTVESARMKAKALLVETDQHGAPLVVIEAKKPDSAKPLTFGDFINEHYKPWARTHQKRGQATIDNIAACFGYLDAKLLTEITGHDLEKFKTKRLKAGRAVGTVNRDLDRIRGALSRAVDWGMLATHPLKAVKRAKGDDNSRVRYLEKDEEERLRAALLAREATRRASRESGNTWSKERGRDARPTWPSNGFTDHLMPLIVVAMNTGCRRGELFGLEWRSVNLESALLTVAAGNAKSRKARHVPLNTEALDVLKRWRQQSDGTGLVFPSAGGGRFDNVNKAWGNLTDEAKLVDFRFHDLRHDFASKLVMAGVDLNTVRELMGHADIKMTLRYAHLAPHKLADAVAKLGAK